MELHQDLKGAEILRLQPGDTLVFKTEHVLNFEQAVTLKKHLKAVAPSDVQILILDGGSELKVLRAQDHQA